MIFLLSQHAGLSKDFFPIPEYLQRLRRICISNPRLRLRGFIGFLPPMQDRRILDRKTCHWGGVSFPGARGHDGRPERKANSFDLSPSDRFALFAHSKPLGGPARRAGGEALGDRGRSPTGGRRPRKRVFPPEAGRVARYAGSERGERSDEGAQRRACPTPLGRR